MKAAKIIDVGKIAVDEIEKPQVRYPDDVLVKVKMVGICGTDLHIFKAGREDVQFPRIMGHELSGIVEDIGEAVKNVIPGDHVILDPVMACGACRLCRRGHPNVCTHVKCFGVQCDGGYCEYIVVKADRLFAFDRQVSFKTAALGEPFSIASNILGRTELKTGEKLLVIGAGTIGLSIIQLAHAFGADILAADIFDRKLRFAKELGADRVVNSKKENLKNAVSEFAPEGLDVIIDAVGSSQIIEQVMDFASPLTRLSVIGFDSKPAQIPIVKITKNELTLVGSRMNCNQFPHVINWLNNGTITDRMVTAEFFLDEIQKAFIYTLNNPETSIKTMICIG